MLTLVRKYNKDPKFKIVDIVRIHSKLVWKGSCDKKLKNTVSWTYIISDLNGAKIAGSFYEK